MAYPQPPGTTNNLPAKPPTATGGFNKGSFRPAFSSISQPPAKSYAAPYSSAPSYGASAPPSQYGPSSFPQYGGAPVNAALPYSYPQQPQSFVTPQSYGPSQSSYTAPQIKNPFVAPGAGGPAAEQYDPEMAAQIAQWQSAYGSGDTAGKDGKPMEQLPKVEIPTVNANSDKKRTVVREGGGKKWTDDSLLEWDPSHLRLFVGNLAGETTDDSLLKAFSRWKSVQKARVVREKRTTKSKGFGFVSFSDADDFFQAAKEMNGKYIQSHPVVVRKANTEIKATSVKEKDRGRKGRNDRKKGGSGSNGQAYEPDLGPKGGAGVTKPGQKTKNGLRLLG